MLENLCKAGAPIWLITKLLDHITLDNIQIIDEGTGRENGKLPNVRCSKARGNAKMQIIQKLWKTQSSDNNLLTIKQNTNKLKIE